MNKEYIDFKKNEIENKINNLTFYRNIHIYLTGGYIFVATQSTNELIMNDFKFCGVYIPIILGSIGIVIHSFKTAKKTNYKLKKINTELHMLEFQERVEQKLKSSKYLLKK